MKRATRISWILVLGFGLGLGASAVMAQEPEAGHAEAGHEGSDYTRVLKVVRAGRGFLGVELTPLTPELRVHFGVPEDTGILVARVEAGGPAEAAGIEVGDIVSAVDGERIDSSRRLARAVRDKKSGDIVDIELYRDGGLQNFAVTVSERDRQVFDLAGGYAFLPGMPAGELPGHDVVIRVPELDLDEESMEAFEHAIEGLGEHLDSGEWREKLEHLETLDFTTIQERMKEVERRLKELEKELEKVDEKEL